MPIIGLSQEARPGAKLFNCAGRRCTRHAPCRNDKALFRGLCFPLASPRPTEEEYRANEVYGVGILPVGHFVSPVTRE